MFKKVVQCYMSVDACMSADACSTSHRHTQIHNMQTILTRTAGAGKHNCADTEPPQPTAHKQPAHDDKLQTIIAMQREVLKHCQLAVTTRGNLGCIAMDHTQHCCEPAVQISSVKDTTGAGDLFGAGFLYGQLCKSSLQSCCRIGCIVGAAATQVCPFKTSVGSPFANPKAQSIAEARGKGDRRNLSLLLGNLVGVVYAISIIPYKAES